MAPSSKPTKDTKTKSEATPASTNGTSTPVSSSAAAETSTPSTSTRPDKKVYDQEQDKLKSEIDALQNKLSAVKDKISLATKSGPGKERREGLRKELDEIKGQQSQGKRSRGKILEQVNTINEGVKKKIQDLNAAKGKTQFKTVADVDNHIKNLEKQVESGNMKLAEEKRALQDITQSKRARRTVESFQKDQDAIDTDRKTLEELRKQLDDPEAKAASDKYDSIKSQLDALKKEEDEAYAGRSKLFEERDGLQAQVNELWNQKRASSQQYRDANDKYWTKVNEDRARRAERARTQRAADEAERKKEIATQLREEAEVPAFQAQIEDCQTLVDYFSGKSTGTVTLNSASAEKAELTGVPKLELRQVESKDDGLVVQKKKGNEEDYFVAGKGKKGGKKGTKPTPSEPKEPKETNGTSSGALNVPLPTLTALLTLSIPPPASNADVPRVIEDLKTKKAWFQANQSRVTAENIAKAEANIKRLTDGQTKEVSVPSADTDVTGPNGGGEVPAEPAPTPKVTDIPSTGVPTEAVDEKLESVAEDAS